MKTTTKPTAKAAPITQDAIAAATQRILTVVASGHMIGREKLAINLLGSPEISAAEIIKALKTVQPDRKPSAEDLERSRMLGALVSMAAAPASNAASGWDKAVAAANALNGFEQ
ncbi:MAG TPA: hypothetical protein PK680_10690 [Novosphingobium sp.]|nr:hypothetical protein [Novosphingobium sp.]